MDIRCAVYIATSVDGYIAGPGGDIDWLQRPEYALSDDRGLTYDRFIAGIDAIVMGRNTFAKVLTFGFWPYEGVPVVVLSRRGVDVPEALRSKVSVTGGTPRAIAGLLAAQGKKNLYIDGGITIQQFLRAGLIHELTITQVPILLGAGIPLFASIDSPVPLRLVDTTVFDNGLVQLRYRVPAGAAAGA